MQVSELIGGQVITCTPDTTVTKAAGLMVANDAGSLAVVMDDDLVGIITERDLIGCVANGFDSETRVVSVMTPNPDSLEPDVELRDAADWMLGAGYRHLPVVEGGRLIGMLSIKDVLWGLVDGRAG